MDHTYRRSTKFGGSYSVDPREALGREFGPVVVGRAAAKWRVGDSVEALRALCVLEAEARELEIRACGPDLVVTVPRDRWAEWLREGDLAGDPPSGKDHNFTLWLDPSDQPPPTNARRLYIVGQGALRGFAPVVDVMPKMIGRKVGKQGWQIVRRGGAVACTIDGRIAGFPGFKFRWWDLEAERPFANWKSGDGRPGSTGQTVADVMGRK